MKSLLVRLGVIPVGIGLFIFAYAEVRGADWKLLKNTEDGHFYYDPADITHESQGIVRVQVKHVYTKKGIVDMAKLLGPHYENLGHSIELLELNCTSKMVRFLSMIYYSKQEYILEVENPTDKWEVFHANSMFDALYKEVCK